MAIIELDQAYETRLTVYRRGAFSLRYAAGRSKDSIASGQRGQDYLTLRVEPQQLAFAVCDGVGNSFFGGLGAQLVGEQTVRWLWDLADVSDSSPGALGEALQAHLNGQIGLGQVIVAGKDLSRFGNELQRQAYANQIAKAGTQSNFVAGRLDAPTLDRPQGRLLLCWLGDARLKIFRGATDGTGQLGADWRSSDGWASRDGVHGSVSCFVGNLTVADCVMAYTDGLLSIEPELRPGLSAEIIDKAFAHLQKQRNSDDLTFLEITMSREILDFEDDIVSRVRLAEMYSLPAAHSSQAEAPSVSVQSSSSGSAMESVPLSEPKPLEPIAMPLAKAEVLASPEAEPILGHQPGPRRQAWTWGCGVVGTVFFILVVATWACFIGYQLGARGWVGLGINGQPTAIDTIDASVTPTELVTPAIATRTATAIATVTETIAPTSTATPTTTAMPTETQTATAAPTETATPTATETETATTTPTETATSTLL